MDPKRKVETMLDILAKWQRTLAPSEIFSLNDINHHIPWPRQNSFPSFLDKESFRCSTFMTQTLSLFWGQHNPFQSRIYDIDWVYFFCSPLQGWHTERDCIIFMAYTLFIYRVWYGWREVLLCAKLVLVIFRSKTSKTAKKWCFLRCFSYFYNKS